MSNQSPPQMVNPGESHIPPYGQPPVGGPGGQGPPPHHPGMMQMGPGMPYPPYMMFPMGGPFYMPHPDMGGQMPHPEMQFQPHMMPMQFGYPPHPMMGMPQHQPPPTQLNPNVPTFVPSKQPAKPAPAPVSKPTTPLETPAVPAAAEPAAKPVSRRLAIIDPTTGEEISFQPKSLGPISPPASALTPADVALRTLAPKPSSTAETPQPTATPSETIPATSGAEESSTGKRMMKLRNAPLAKPVKPVIPEPPIAVTPELPAPHKVLRGIKNVPLIRKSVTPLESSDATSTPPLAADSAMLKPKLRLVNKTLSAPKVVVAPLAATPTTFPLSRDMFLQYLSTSRPDRNAPSSINVFPSELLGLRTALHGDPGLTAARSRRGVSLQKTMSAVSTGSGRDWRAGRKPLTRQTSRGGKMMVNQIVRPSERGFKIIDQSSLSEKDKLRRQVMSLLNKITVDSFASITTLIAEIEISQPWQMDVVIGLVFDKAVVEHHYSEMYAEMCKKLRTTWPELTGVDQETGQSVPVTFTRAIIEKCQVEFDAIPDTLEPTEADLAKAKGNVEDLEMFMQKRKERILGNMKFIAQLFLMNILSSRVIRSVVEQLLFRMEEPEEHYIECVGILMHNIGATLMESEGGRAYVGSFVERMHELAPKECYGKRIKFLMKDIVDAAEAGWEGKHAGNRLATAAKSKEDARKEAAAEAVKKPEAPVRRTTSGYQPRQPVQQQQQSFKPQGVLRRSSQEELPVAVAKQKPVEAKEGEWSNEEDEVSEFESSQESDDGFTQVAPKRV